MVKRLRNSIEFMEEKREEEKKKGTPHSPAENVAIVGEKTTNRMPTETTARIDQ